MAPPLAKKFFFDIVKKLENLVWPPLVWALVSNEHLAPPFWNPKYAIDFFLWWKKICWPRGPWPIAPPKYATGSTLDGPCFLPLSHVYYRFCTCLSSHICTIFCTFRPTYSQWTPLFHAYPTSLHSGRITWLHGRDAPDVFIWRRNGR